MKVHWVTFKFEEPNKKEVRVKAVEGETVLDLTLENGIELHHNCGGVCACTTCQIYIESGMENLPPMSEREEDYIDRALYPKLESRLGCQCEVLGDIVLTVPDQRLMLGS